MRDWSSPISSLGEEVLARLCQLLDISGCGWRRLAEVAAVEKRFRCSEEELEMCSLKVLEPHGSPSQRLLHPAGPAALPGEDGAHAGLPRPQQCRPGHGSHCGAAAVAGGGRGDARVPELPGRRPTGAHVPVVLREAGGAWSHGPGAGDGRGRAAGPF